MPNISCTLTELCYLMPLKHSFIVILFHHHVFTNHGFADSANPRLHVLSIVCNKQECTIRRVHTEAVLLASVFRSRLHSRAVFHTNAFGWVTSLCLGLEAANILRRQNDPSPFPVLEVERLLREPTLLEDIVLVNDDLVGHDEVRLESDFARHRQGSR